MGGAEERLHDIFMIFMAIIALKSNAVNDVGHI